MFLCVTRFQLTVNPDGRTEDVEGTRTFHPSWAPWRART